MSGRLKKVFPVLASLLLSALLFAGCAKISGALGSVGNTPVPPETTDAPTDGPSPSPSEDANPLFGLIGDFTDDFRSASFGLFEEVYENGGESVRSAYLSLMSDEALAAMLRPTAGMLPVFSDAGLFGSSVTGPFAGTGVMKDDGEFSYSFETGGSLSGRLSDGQVVTASVSRGGLSADLILSSADGGWLLRVSRGSGTGFLKIGAEGLRYVYLDPSVPVPDDPAFFPDEEGALVFEGGVLR